MGGLVAVAVHSMAALLASDRALDPLIGFSSTWEGNTDCEDINNVVQLRILPLPTWCTHPVQLPYSLSAVSHDSHELIGILIAR